MRTATGEIDYVLKHSIANSFWGLSPYVTIECKNWKEPIEPGQLDHFLSLVRKSGPYCTIGVYVTVSRLTEGSWTTIRDARINDRISVVVIQADQLKRMSQGLKHLVQELYENQTFQA
jgi:hypothetical protein